MVTLKREQVMNSQQACEPAAKVEVTGRPMWQVSLRASVQRGQKRLKARLRARVLKQCPPGQPQVLRQVAQP